MDVPFRIRPATRLDLPALVQLERDCFSDPWSPQGLAEVVADRLCVTLVVEEDSEVSGYAMARVVAGQAEILTLGVSPGRRRQGIARLMLERLLSALAGRGAEDVWLEVRASNLAAQALYQAYGFLPGGMRRAYYRRPTEDALVFRLALGPPPA